MRMSSLMPLRCINSTEDTTAVHVTTTEFVIRYIISRPISFRISRLNSGPSVGFPSFAQDSFRLSENYLAIIGWQIST